VSHISLLIHKNYINNINTLLFFLTFFEGHHHDTAKGAAAGAAAACVVPGIGPVVGGIVGGAIGHHEKNKHQAEAMAGVRPAY
jgi:hypothetical protein